MKTSNISRVRQVINWSIPFLTIFQPQTQLKGCNCHLLMWIKCSTRSINLASKPYTLWLVDSRLTNAICFESFPIQGPFICFCFFASVKGCEVYSFVCLLYLFTVVYQTVSGHIGISHKFSWLWTPSILYRCIPCISYTFLVCFYLLLTILGWRYRK